MPLRNERQRSECSICRENSKTERKHEKAMKEKKNKKKKQKKKNKRISRGGGKSVGKNGGNGGCWWCCALKDLIRFLFYISFHFIQNIIRRIFIAFYFRVPFDRHTLRIDIGSESKERQSK